MDVVEIAAKITQFIKQYDVDLSKKAITPLQCVDFLCAYWNGMYTAGLIDNTGYTEAGTLWSQHVEWFDLHGYPLVSAELDEIGGGGGWTTYPLTSTP